MVTCNVVIPQIFWFKAARRSIPIMFVVSIFVNIGMWFERFVITVTSLHRDFLPANWGLFEFTFYDIGVIVGSWSSIALAPSLLTIWSGASRSSARA